MDDLALTRACAEAMGIILKIHHDDNPNFDHWRQLSSDKIYDPLHDDAQAMALVKRFRLQIDPHDDQWNVASVGKSAALREDLNRAIVECVAKLKERP